MRFHSEGTHNSAIHTKADDSPSPRMLGSRKNTHRHPYTARTVSQAGSITRPDPTRFNAIRQGLRDTRASANLSPGGDHDKPLPPQPFFVLLISRRRSHQNFCATTLHVRITVSRCTILKIAIIWTALTEIHADAVGDKLFQMLPATSKTRVYWAEMRETC